MVANGVIEAELTWVTMDQAAAYAGVSRSTVAKACADHALPVRVDGRRRLVPLERVLARTTGKDIDALRPRLDRASSLPDAPAAVRAWASALLRVLGPVLDRLEAAEQRAAVAEAKIELLQNRLS